MLNTLYQEALDRKTNPKEGSYTNYLYTKGLDKILKKVGEESTDVVLAAKNADKDDIVAYKKENNTSAYVYYYNEDINEYKENKN